MRNSILLAFFIFVIIIGCTKETTVNPVTSAVSDQAVTNSSAADTYLPLTKGTNWSYGILTASLKTGYNDTSKLTVLGIHKKINTKDYTVVTSVRNESTDTLYYNQTQHNYYLYTGKAGTDDGAIDLEILFLRDDLPVGGKWTQSAGSAGGVTLKCYGKILEKNITITVGGVKYQNVIHSYVEIKKPLLFTGILLNKQHFYVAKNIGVVKNVSTVVYPVTSTSTTELIKYNIK